ncbi:MAG: hypothetical protein EXR61_03190 [Chloroflexi bacterium]|nr:hypothetical protein [Chloroflexota bacterium]
MSGPEVRLVALCDHAIIGQDGKVSLLGIFRTINVSGLPAEHPRMYLVAILALEAGAHSVVVQLHRPDGSPAMPNPPEISVQGAAGQDVNVIVELNKINFGTYGVHHFSIEVDGGPTGTVAVSIDAMNPPGGQGRRAN